MPELGCDTSPIFKQNDEQLSRCSETQSRPETLEMGHTPGGLRCPVRLALALEFHAPFSIGFGTTDASTRCHARASSDCAQRRAIHSPPDWAEPEESRHYSAALAR